MKLTDLPPAWSEDVLPAIRDEIARSGRRLVVLDDDPTGTQTSHGVLVVTEWTEDELAGALQATNPAIFVLTNSRSLPEGEAVALAVEAGRNLARASKRVGVDVAIGYRGDSTLRGHYPAESWALRDAFAAESGKPFDGEILAPFFEEGGRFTIGDTHYVQQGEELVPAGETEFARDNAFGYRSSFLPAWVQEKSQGRVAAGVVGSVSIEDIREGGPGRVEEILKAANGGKIVVANSASYRDMEVFVLGLLRAEAAGARFIYRVSASFVRVRAGLAGRPLLTIADLYPAGAPPVAGITFVGSHVRRSTEQLEQAVNLPDLQVRELRVNRLLEPSTRDAEVHDMVSWLEDQYPRGRDALVYTSRGVVTGQSAEESLQVSQTVSAAMVDVAQRLKTPPRYVIAKGGITSNDLALKAFGVHQATVPGQVAPGIPCWVLGQESRFPGVPYVIFPGNVGTPKTLADVIAMLRGA
ncbi:MAG: four-carbon acid sugar kinase family protein [Chloroflexota bacterium]